MHLTLFLKRLGKNCNNRFSILIKSTEERKITFYIIRVCFRALLALRCKNHHT